MLLLRGLPTGPRLGGGVDGLGDDNLRLEQHLVDRGVRGILRGGRGGDALEGAPIDASRARRGFFARVSASRRAGNGKRWPTYVPPPAARDIVIFCVVVVENLCA